jgi:hypothetical protein
MKPSSWRRLMPLKLLKKLRPRLPKPKQKKVRIINKKAVEVARRREKKLLLLWHSVEEHVCFMSISSQASMKENSLNLLKLDNLHLTLSSP